MILKEAYRYMNFLDDLLSKSYSYLSTRDFITNTVQVHQKNKIISGATDETLEVNKAVNVEFSPNDVINFTVKVLDQKEKLSDAISDAKRGTPIDIDHSVSMNKKRQDFVYKLKSMDSIKNSESTSKGTGYQINPVDGNQISYYYDIVSTTTIDFDRKDVKALIKKYSKINDDISSTLDKIQIETNVEFEPLWDICDSYEDLVLA